MRTLASKARASFSASIRLRPKTLRGAITRFSSTDRCGNRLYCWNTNPTRLRNSMRWASWVRVSTRVSPTRMVQRWGCNRPVMQRRMVDFPEPDGPMIDTAWPRWTSRSMPLSTGLAPNDKCRSRRLTRGSATVSIEGITSLQALGQSGNRVAISKEQHQQAQVNHHGETGHVYGVAGDLRGVDHVMHAHQGCQRGAHGDDRVEVHPRRQHPLEALRQDDRTENLPTGEGQGTRGFPLGAGDRGNGTTEDFRNVGARRQGQANGDFDPVRKRDV